MKKLFQPLKNNLKYGFIALLGIPFLLGGVFADDDYYEGEDLLYNIFHVAAEKGTMIDMGRHSKVTGTRFFEGGADLEFNNDSGSWEFHRNDSPSVVVKITKFLLSIVVAISVTMILWNGIKYIIETGNGKESKTLVPNLIYIMVGIILALFSVTIITILQSIPNSLEGDLGKTETDQVFQSDSK